MLCKSNRTLKVSLVSILLAGLIGCSDDNTISIPEAVPAPEQTVTLSADIVWTEFGIPHITADDWESLGYGYGFAYAQQSYCVVMREIVRANGNSALYLGDDGDLNEDLVFKLFNSDERIQLIFNDTVPDKVLDVTAGYAAGFNRYLAETGVDNLSQGEEGCRSEPWVREITDKDIAKLLHKSILVASSEALADFSVAAQPSTGTAAIHKPKQLNKLLAAIDKDVMVEALGMPTPEQLGSNAYAVGADASQTDVGVLLGNPHFPWQGHRRWFMSHLTIPGQYDMMGATLAGVPILTIGFNGNVAWSHTVSTGSRFTFYELELNPDDPMQYIYDGEILDIESQVVTAQQTLADGTVEDVEHTFYFSHFGPIVDLGQVSPLLGGWPNSAGSLLTYRDANLDNLRSVDQWIQMGQSTNLTEFKESLKPIGIPWVNTIAVDRNGDAFYGDISAMPNVSVDQYGSCIRSSVQGLLTNFGFITLDGSDSTCEWANDENTTEGIFGYDNLPKLENREYVGNANDSYWLSNPSTLLEGFSPVIGEEGVEQSLRTRQTFVQAEERMAGSDGLGDAGFNIDNIRQMLYGSRNIAAELTLENVVEICSAVEDWTPYTSDTATVTEACTILAAWDSLYLTTSVGSHIFYEFWREVRGINNLWATPFDVTDPVNTPRDLNIGDAAVVEGVKQSLANGVATLTAAGIAMNRPWGEVQYDEKNGVKIPIHGGSSSFMFSVISSDLVDGEGYSDIVHGNSYIQAVTWDETDCPNVFAVLTYSQSPDPESDHFDDATKLYSDGGWIDMPYCEADIDAAEIRRESISN